MTTILEPPAKRWYCPACHAEDETRQAKPHTRMHSCAALLGMTVPMVPAGVSAKVELVDREDYVGDELITPAPDGRVYMAAQVVRDDGNDVAVYPATARGGTAAS